MVTSFLFGVAGVGLLSASINVVGIDSAAGAPRPHQTDDGDSEEPADPPEGEDDVEEPADPTEGDNDSEPPPEPGDVSAVVWIGAGALVIVAIIWGVSIAGGD